MATPVGFQSLTISTAAVALTVPNNAKCFLGRVESAIVRYRSDGTNPTASVGRLVDSGAPILLGGIEMKRVAFIRNDTQDATLQGHYYAEEEGLIAALAPYLG